MSDSLEDTLAFLAEQHIVGRWTNLPVLETLAPAILAPLSKKQHDEILTQLEKEGVPAETLTHITQTLAYRQMLRQLTMFFQKLRHAGFPLGPEEYRMLLDGLQLGIMGHDKASLKRLCRLIWLNDQETEGLFEHFFDTTVTDLVTPPPPPQPAKPEAELKTEPKREADTKKPPAADQPKQSNDTTETTEAADQPKLPDDTTETTTDAADLPPELHPHPTDKEMLAIEEHISAEEAAMLTLKVQDTEIAYQTFMQATDYFPVTRRRLKQNWRYLRRMVRSGPPGEIDINATVQKLAQEGFLLEPILRPRRINRSELLLLIDRQGSMVPFHGMGRRIEETAVESGRLGHIKTYYFRNVPPLHKDARHLPASALYRPHNLFQKPQCISAISVEEVAHLFDPLFTSVLIFSDAGAARGGWSEERIQGTARFLYQLRLLGFEEIAWLNPMPKDRWDEDQENSAAEIAKFAPMFSMDHASLFEAINTLRGRTARKVTFQV